jgi:hypothetical protein
MPDSLSRQLLEKKRQAILIELERQRDRLQRLYGALACIDDLLKTAAEETAETEVTNYG